MLFAGHQYFREAAGALDKYAPVTKEQQEHMKKGLEKALEAGCVGISYGLRYVPGTGRDRCRQRGDSQFDRTGNLCRQSGTTNQ
jgi:N-acyl-D-amino-acid deacylase